MKKMHLIRNPKNDAHSNPGQMKAFVQGPLPPSNERRLFLEDGTPSDYLGSSVLNLCKSSRPKSASNKSDISKKAYDELSEERLTNDVKIIAVLQNCIQSFSDTNSTEGHTYKLSCDVTSLNRILHREYGKNSCDMETKCKRVAFLLKVVRYRKKLVTPLYHIMNQMILCTR
jgi:hypothetical protein